MKLILDAVAIVAKDLEKTLGFYRALGFDPKRHADTDHYEATQENWLRLMIDTDELLTSLGKPSATPANFSIFAILCETPTHVDEVVGRAVTNGGTIIVEPADMFWWQRYATVADPNGNQIDLFAALKYNA